MRVNRSLEALVGDAGVLGRGGMLTKLRAARLASRSGAATVIAYGHEPDVLAAVLAGQSVGTLLSSDQEVLAARKQWLAGHLQLCGQLVLDDGAVKVLRESGRSLLSVGVMAVSGEFARGDAVACVDQKGVEVARGLVNYNAAEAQKIKGLPSAEMETVLGYVDEPELIHRDNLVLC